MVRFVKNGDKFFEGVKINITQRTMRSWDTLLAELSRRIELPAGVRQVYTPERGHRIKSLSQLEHHKTYVCGSMEPFRKMNYEKVKNPDWKTTSRIRVSDAGFPALSPFDPDASMSASSRNTSLNLNASMGATSRSTRNLNASMRSLTESELDLSAVRKRRAFQKQRRLHCLNSINEPEVSIFEPPRPKPKPKSPPPVPSASKQLSLTIIRNAPPPRSRVSLLISKDTVKSWEEAKLLISENLKTVNGHLRLFSLEGTEVESLSQMWTAGRTLIAAGNEKFDIVDFLMGSGKSGEDRAMIA